MTYPSAKATVHFSATPPPAVSARSSPPHSTGLLVLVSPATCPPTKEHSSHPTSGRLAPHCSATSYTAPRRTICRQTASWNGSTGPSRPHSEPASPQWPGWMSSCGCSLASGPCPRTTWACHQQRWSTGLPSPCLGISSRHRPRSIQPDTCGSYAIVSKLWPHYDSPPWPAPPPVFCPCLPHCDTVCLCAPRREEEAHTVTLHPSIPGSLVREQNLHHRLRQQGGDGQHPPPQAGPRGPRGPCPGGPASSPSSRQGT